ncbi:MAG TPA: hypothetical protein VFW83_00105 [Bryobacteraceae bacterium]|nr:hypothetical protein [Bryobacteraceae bacterium]
MAKAAEAGRVLVSHDVTAMERHFREFAAKQTSPGIVLILDIYQKY